MASQISEILAKSTKILIVCGAGLSQESGVPTYRGTNPLNQTAGSPIQVLITPIPTRTDFNNMPSEVISHFSELKRKIDQCEPCEAHKKLKILVDSLISNGKEVLVCTQNIDDFEIEVGLEVIQLHGSISNLEMFKAIGIGIVLSGDIIDRNVMDHVSIFFSECDLLLMIGTSGEMMPWSIFPRVIVQSGSPFIYINFEETKISKYATILIKNTASNGLQELLKYIDKISPRI